MHCMIDPLLQVEQQTCGSQVPEDLYSSVQQPKSAHAWQQHVPQDLLAAANPAFAEFLDWAVPQVLFELQRAEATAAAEGRLLSATAGLCYGVLQTALQASSSSSSGGSGCRSLLSGELQLAGSGLLAGRPVIGLAGPPTQAAAAGAAAAVSSHLLLVCYGPVAMTPAAAIREHGMAGLGCICVWDVQQAGSSKPTPAPVTSSSSSHLPDGVLQLLVSEGRPTCCCWGAGEASCLVFAGRSTPANHVENCTGTVLASVSFSTHTNSRAYKMCFAVKSSSQLFEPVWSMLTHSPSAVCTCCRYGGRQHLLLGPVRARQVTLCSTASYRPTAAAAAGAGAAQLTHSSQTALIYHRSANLNRQLQPRQL